MSLKSRWPLFQVKNVYVVGWSETRTEEQIQELFMPFGTVEKVKKIGNYSFVHYAERDQALAGIRFEILWFVILQNTMISSNLVGFSKYFRSKIFFGRISIFDNPTKFNLIMIILNLWKLLNRWTVKKYHQERLLHVQLPNQVKIIEIKIAADGVSFFLRGKQGGKTFLFR